MEEKEDLRVLTIKKDYQTTYDAILVHDEYLRDHLIPLLMDDSMVKKFESGWYYGLGRDNSQRPIVVMSFRKMIDSGVDFE